MSTPYPSSFPVAETGALIAAIRGTSADLPVAIHAGWVVAGYALSQVIPVAQGPSVLPVARTTSTPGTPVTEEDLANCLERMQASHQTGAASAIDWQSILGILLPLVLKWITNRSQMPA